MAVYGKKLLDNEGNTILPKTRASLVYTSDDETVEKKISGIIDGTIVVGKSTDTTKVIGRDAVYSDNGWWYLHNTGSDKHFENCIPYYYTRKAKLIVPNVYSDAANTYGNEISLEIWGDNNIYFYDNKKRTVIPRGYDPDKMPKSGGEFSGWVTCSSGFTVNGNTFLQGSTSLNGQCSIAIDKSPGNGTYVQPANIPNISQNIRCIIYWT